MAKKKEKDLKIHDVWRSPNGNLFLKVTDEYSLALGTKSDMGPGAFEGSNLIFTTSYIKASNVVPVRKVGRIVWTKRKKKKLYGTK